MTVFDEALIREEMSSLLRGREDVGVHVTPVDFGVGSTGTLVVELTRMSSDECYGCGQSLPTESPGPVAWVDPRTGDNQGGHSYQHGCGEWNVPCCVHRTLHDADFPDDAEAAQTAVSDVLHNLLGKLDQEVAYAVAEEADGVRRRLTRDLRAALRKLADGAAPEDVETGSELEPGVCRRDGGEWMAWDYPPLGREGDYVAVYESQFETQASS